MKIMKIVCRQCRHIIGLNYILEGLKKIKRERPIIRPNLKENLGREKAGSKILCVIINSHMKNDNSKRKPGEPLKSPKQEQFVQELLRQPSATKAYKETYKCSYGTARVQSSDSLANTDIRNRFMELLQRQKAGLPRVSERLRDHLESETESISLDTCKTILKVAGVFDPIDNAANMQNIQINISTLAPDSKA